MSRLLGARWNLWWANGVRGRHLNAVPLCAHRKQFDVAIAVGACLFRIDLMAVQISGIQRGVERLQIYLAEGLSDSASNKLRRTMGERPHKWCQGEEKRLEELLKKLGEELSSLVK